ncbi:TonB-dependent siderophore receptor [Calothrix sp. PCC 7507]|uniref:TonB-dependent siderophore receptor n=1 Tax=Calothrix sp. PCC 7507 TaxID=99598 RepID=UPI0011818B81|nr:TonB-dependent siderophore receptor [Calothrix sp. PCC 7507]
MLKNCQLIAGVWVTSFLSILAIPSVCAIEPSVTNAAFLLAQQSNQAVVVQVTGIKVNQTETGLEIILETKEAEKLQLLPKSDGNNYIVDIPVAQLRLASGNTFRQENPTKGITLVTANNPDVNSIRLIVTGETSIPKIELFDSDEGLIFSVKPVVSQSQQQPETPDTVQPRSETSENETPIELVVTGEQDGYRVPDASTATKTDTPIRDVPQSIQVIPQKVIEDQKIIRISDAVRNVSGVTPQGGYAGNTDNYNIRGFTTYDNLRNGFYSQDGNVNPTNIDRIEVLKGPASVLYGQFEPGGVVNYITKQPLSQPYYSGEFTVGSYNTYRPSIDISGPLNSERTLLYRLNTAYESSGSFIDFVDQESFFIAPTLTYKISDATSLTFEYEYSKVNRTYYDGSPPDPIIFQRPISLFLGEPDTKDYYRESNNVNLTFEHRFSENLKLRSAFSAELYNEDAKTIRPDSIDADGRTVLRRFAAGPGYLENYSLQTQIVGKFNTGSIQHQMLLGLDLNKYIYGYDFLRTPANSIDLFNPVYGSPLPTSFETARKERYDRNTIGLYLQDQVSLLPNLKLLVGGRVDFINRKNRTQDLDGSGTNLIGDATTEDFYDSPFSPRVGIVYQPIEPISLYASYSSSFNPSSSRTATGSTLPPESGTQYEVGIKAEALGGKLSAILAAYEITKQNVATTDPNNTDFSIAAGEVKSRGIELDISGEILPGWNIIASYFVNDAFVSEDNDPTLRGNRLVNAPRQGGSLWTTYEIQSGDLQGLGFGGGVFFVGDRAASLPNTFDIPSYVRTDATIFYKRDNWRVGLNFKNLFDIQSFDSQGYYLRPNAPFTVLGTISVQF